MSHERDVLAELFSDPDTKPEPGQAELIRLIYRRETKKAGIEKSQSRA